MKSIRFLVPFALTLAALSLPLLAGTALAAPSAKEVAVEVVDSAFQPKTITINAGDTIVWTNTGAMGHTVTASDQSWDSGRLAPGQSFSRTFDTPGTIAYYCRPHGTPAGAGMAGTIVVLAASSAAPEASTAAQSAPDQGSAAQLAPDQGTPVPQAIPSAGSQESSNLWLLAGGAAVILLLAGALILGGGVARPRE